MYFDNFLALKTIIAIITTIIMIITLLSLLLPLLSLLLSLLSLLLLSLLLSLLLIISAISLTHCHIGQLLFEKKTGKLFAGAHADGGMWVSDDGKGKNWRSVNKGLSRKHIYALASRRINEDVTMFAGTSPAGLYRSNDLGENWDRLRGSR